MSIEDVSRENNSPNVGGKGKDDTSQNNEHNNQVNVNNQFGNSTVGNENRETGDKNDIDDQKGKESVVPDNAYVTNVGDNEMPWIGERFLEEAKNVDEKISRLKGYEKLRMIRFIEGTNSVTELEDGEFKNLLLQYLIAKRKGYSFKCFENPGDWNW
ncbi:MAG: hypothetical protein ACOX6Q_02750 [Candidatus Dojkabacteria bacterium]|jgi:hypothetical protein